MCGLEALGIAADWTSRAAISRTPIYAYSVVLFFDFLIYSVLAMIIIDAHHRTKTPVISAKGDKKQKKKNTKSTDNSSHRKRSKGSKSDDSHDNDNDSNSDGDNDTSPSSSQTLPHTPTTLQTAFTLGLWTLQILGSGLSRVFTEASSGLGYFWGRDVHTYTSVQQHQQQQNNLDIYNSMTPKGRVIGTKSYDEFGTYSNQNFSPRKSHHKSFSSRSTPRPGHTPTECFTPPAKHGKRIAEEDGMDNAIELNSLSRKERDRQNSVYGDEERGGMYQPSSSGRSKSKSGSILRESGRESSDRFDSRDSTETDRRYLKESSGKTQTHTQNCMRITDVSKEYRTGTDGASVVILHRVCAELRQGTVTCLLGKRYLSVCLSLSLFD